MKNLNFKDAKEKYNSIEAPESLRKSVDRMFNSKARTIKYLSSGVASVFVVFTVMLNINPAFATSLATNDFMKPIVNILTGNIFEFHENNMDAKIVSPVIEGIADEKLEKQINEEIKNMADELIEEFKSESDLLKEIDENAHLGIESSYIVKTNNEDVLSIDIYVVNTVGSSSTVHKFYNINKHTGKIIKLKDNFECEEDYLEIISKYIEKQMIEQNLEKGYDIYFAKYEDIYKLISQNESFYINEKGNVVITFDKYEVGPGSTGCPEFEIEL